jgi:acetyl esterase
MSTAVNGGPVSTHRIPLEQAAQDFADATANPPFLYDLGPEKGREVVSQTQAGEIAKPEVIDEWIKVPGGPNGDVSVRIVRPGRSHRHPDGGSVHPRSRVGVRQRRHP